MKELNIDEINLVSGGRNDDGGMRFHGMGMFSNLGQALSALRGGTGGYFSAQAASNYSSYKSRRDRSGDPMSRARSRSRSDMNSPGDSRSTDRRGGR